MPLNKAADAARKKRQRSMANQNTRNDETAAKHSRRENETNEERQRQQKTNNLQHKLQREKESHEHHHSRQVTDRLAHQTARENAPQEILEIVQNQNAIAHRTRYRTKAAMRQSQIETVTQRTRVRTQEERANVRKETVSYVEERVDQHSCGPLNVRCRFCNSKNFLAERSPDGLFKACCSKGRIKLPVAQDIDGNDLPYPEFLRLLLCDTSHPHHNNFMKHIRSYNNAMSFASMGANIEEPPGRGSYVFRIHGQTYHKTSHLEPVDGVPAQYAQLYVLDTDEATDIRQNHAANQDCLEEIFTSLDIFFREHNRIAQSYQMLRDLIQDHPSADIQKVNMVFKRDRIKDQRRYNLPQTNEVAMVFVNDDGEPPFDRDIRIYPKTQKDSTTNFVNLSILSSNMDPMVYPLLFPYGEPGWSPNWQSESYPGSKLNKVRVNVTMRQFKLALITIGDEVNPFLMGGKLFQQYIVDSYLQVVVYLSYNLFQLILMYFIYFLG